MVWHFNYDPAADCWTDDKDGHDLYARIAESLSEKLGRPVEFEELSRRLLADSDALSGDSVDLI